MVNYTSLYTLLVIYAPVLESVWQSSSFDFSLDTKSMDISGGGTEDEFYKRTTQLC
jgi:hypothetical protein